MKRRFAGLLLLLATSISSCSQYDEVQYDNEDSVGIDSNDTASVENITHGEQYIKTVCTQYDVERSLCNKPGYLSINDHTFEIGFDDNVETSENQDDKAYILTQYGVGKGILQNKYGGVFITQTGQSLNQDNIHINDEIHLRVPIAQSEGGDYFTYKIIDIQTIEDYHYESKEDMDNKITIIQNDGNSLVITGQKIADA